MYTVRWVDGQGWCVVNLKDDSVVESCRDELDAYNCLAKYDEYEAEFLKQLAYWL